MMRLHSSKLTRWGFRACCQYHKRTMLRHLSTAAHHDLHFTQYAAKGASQAGDLVYSNTKEQGKQYFGATPSDLQSPEGSSSRSLSTHIVGNSTSASIPVVQSMSAELVFQSPVQCDPPIPHGWVPHNPPPGPSCSENGIDASIRPQLARFPSNLSVPDGWILYSRMAPRRCPPV